MKTPVILLCVAAILCFIGFVFPNWSDILLLGVPMSIASILLLVFAWGRSSVSREPKPDKIPRPKRPPKPRSPKRGKAKWVIIDGSNVMFWKDDNPNIEPVKEVLALLKQRGFTAGVMFDANAGYLLSDSYQHDHVFSRELGLPEDRIMVVPKGTPADPYILAAAIDYDANIVTNDRFRDWADEYPEVKDKGFLITGWYRDGKLMTSLG
jgi:hypothetical protein